MNTIFQDDTSQLVATADELMQLVQSVTTGEPKMCQLPAPANALRQLGQTVTVGDI